MKGYVTLTDDDIDLFSKAISDTNVVILAYSNNNTY